MEHIDRKHFQFTDVGNVMRFQEYTVVTPRRITIESKLTQVSDKWINDYSVQGCQIDCKLGDQIAWTGTMCNGLYVDIRLNGQHYTVKHDELNGIEIEKD